MKNKNMVRDVDITHHMQYYSLMTRTTISLPDEMYQRLVIAAQTKKISAAELMRTLLQDALDFEEKTQLKSLYRGIADLKGLGGKGTIDASSTINQTLYGKQGAWKGNGGA